MTLETRMLTGSVLALLLQLTAAADVEVTTSIESVDAAPVRISGIQSGLVLTDNGLRANVSIDSVELLPSGRKISDISLVCGDTRLTNRAAYCADGEFAATFADVGRQSGAGSFTFRYASSTAEFSLVDFALAGGIVQIEGEVGPSGVDVRFSGTGLHIDGLIEFAALLVPAMGDYSGSGVASVRGRMRGMAESEPRLELNCVLDGVAFANNEGTVAADGLGGDADIDLTFEDDLTRFSLDLSANSGEAYLEPVYAGFQDHAFSLQAEDVTTSDFRTFAIPRFHLRHESRHEMSGEATLRLPAADEEATEISANIALGDSSVAALYVDVLKVALAGTVFDDLETDGRVSGTVTIENNRPTSAKLRLQDVILDDKQERFAVYGLAGQIDWPGTAGRAAEPSALHWDSLTVRNVIADGADVGLQLGRADVDLLAPVRVETLGGALRINRFSLHDFGTPQATGSLDAELEPVQLGELTGALGWPAFSGKLSGRLPLLQLEGDAITVGGTLTGNAFDGGIEVSGLRIEQPFGRVPRLQADIRLRGLDLEQITNVFSFGAIQGRLNGDVTGLRMTNWRIEAMDLHFYTPPDDRSRHRISQRAVENLASVGGGGATAALSSGFLQFFEVFSYDRIGLRCILRTGSCAMSGAGPAGQGADSYYIVKGKGLPRIDVIGYRQNVSWPRLVQQFADITRRSPAIVE